MAGLGSLVIELSANVARFQSDMGKAVHIAERESARIGRAFNTMGTLFKVSIAGLGVGAFTSLVQGAIDAADNLGDLQKRTGVAANELLVLQGAAKRSGVDMGSVSDVASKLSKRLSEAAAGTGEAANAFKAMGISVTNASGGIKNVDQILGEVGKKFQGYEDGANKAALATAALGKGGDRLIPMLETIEETRKRFEELGITISQDTLRKADQFNDTLEDLHSAMDVMATNIAVALLPHLQNMADAMVVIAKHGQNVDTMFQGVAIVVKVVATGFLTLGTAIAAAGEAFIGFELAKERLFSGDFSGAMDELTIGAGKAKARIDGLAATVSALFGTATVAQEKFSKGGARIAAPRLADMAGAKAAADSLVKLQDDRAKRMLESIKRATDQEQQIQDRYYADNLISNDRYWTQKLGIAKGGLDSELAVIDQQLKRQQAAVDKAAKGSKDYNEALNALEATLAKRNELESQFKHGAEITYLDAAKAARDYSDSIERLNIEMLELTNRTGDAAAAALTLQNRDLRQKFTVNNDDGALKKLDTVERLKVAQAKFNEASERTSLVFDDLAIKEGRIQNARRVGSISELDALKRTDDARKATVKLLEEQYQAERRIAEESGNPKLIQDAEKLKLKIQELAAESDLLSEKFDTVFKDSIADNLADAVTGAKSLADAFRDMVNSIVSQISRIAAQDVADTLFGSKKGGGGGDSFGAGLFGSISKIGSRLFGGGGGGGAGWSGMGDFDLPTFAMGSDYIPHDMVAKIHKGERIVTAADNQGWGGDGGSMVVNNNFTINGPTDSRSQTQIAARVSDAVRRARRNR